MKTVESTDLKLIPSSEFDAILSEFMPQVGNYAWAWRLLRKMDAKGGRWLSKTHSVLKRIFNRKKPYFVETTPSGVKFFGDRRDRYSRGCAIDSGCEMWTAEVIAERMKTHEGAYVDLGTNMALLACEVAKRIGPDRMIYAFEPDPNTVKRAAATFALNGVKNVRLFNAAVAEQTGSISFFSAKGRSEASSINRVEPGTEWTEVKVPCTTLDDFFAAECEPKIGFLKIDVEGHEPKVLANSARTLAACPPMMFEYHFLLAPDLGWTAEEVVDSLKARGYSKICVLGPPGQYLDFPPRKENGPAHNILCEAD